MNATDTAPVTVIHPHIKITKSPSSQTVTSGDPATFAIVVKNDGDATLTNVRVSDALTSACNRTSAGIADLASMAPNDSVTYQCTTGALTAGFTNVAVATGTPAIGPDVTASDSAVVMVRPEGDQPHISITKSPATQTVRSRTRPRSRSWSRTSATPRSPNVRVTDALTSACARTSAGLPGLASLAPNESVTYQCSTGSLTTGFTNVAVATGTPEFTAPT